MKTGAAPTSWVPQDPGLALFVLALVCYLMKAFGRGLVGCTSHGLRLGARGRCEQARVRSVMDII
jgi:hypothetical protein